MINVCECDTSAGDVQPADFLLVVDDTSHQLYWDMVLGVRRHHEVVDIALFAGEERVVTLPVSTPVSVERRPRHAGEFTRWRGTRGY